MVYITKDVRNALDSIGIVESKKLIVIQSKKKPISWQNIEIMNMPTIREALDTWKKIVNNPANDNEKIEDKFDEIKENIPDYISITKEIIGG